MNKFQASLIARIASVLFIGREFYVADSRYTHSFHVLGENSFSPDGERDGNTLHDSFMYGRRT